jgi:tetratricopeptide (TPR) repeat protein
MQALLTVLLALVAGCRPAGPSELLQGRNLIEKGKYTRAIESLKRAVSLLPTNAPAWNYLGLACHYGGKPDEAEKAYRQALLLDHDLSEAHYNLGCLLLEQNKAEAARSEFLAYTLRRGNSLDSLLKLGLAQANSRDLVGAEKSFIEALRLSPQHPEALNGMGLVRVQQRRASDAMQCFNAALKKQPDFAPALLNLAILSQQNPQERPTALRLYKEYVALKPPPPNADAVSLLIRQIEQEFTAPRPTPQVAVTPTNIPTVPHPLPLNSNRLPAAFAKTDAANPPRPITSNAITKAAAPSAQPPATPQAPTPLVAQERPPVEILRSEPQVKVAQDVPAVEVSAAPQPEKVPTTVQVPESSSTDRYRYLSPPKPLAGNRTAAEKFFRAGAQAQQDRRLADALAAYGKATQLDPSYFEAYYNLALAAQGTGNTQAALNAFEHALAIQPYSPDARYSFALALKQSNYLADAAAELEKLLARYPNDGRAHLALGNLYAQNFDEPSKARSHYLKALDTDPQSPQAGAVRYWLAAHPQ